MQLFIRIENDGEVDPLAFNLIGASTKRADNSKIGFFGSGNKYAIALLLRKNIFFKVYSGTREIVFGKKPVTFRDGTYEMITIDGQDTSMTTDMGPTWEDWFIVREFYCNALDEGQALISVTDDIKPVAGKTTIYIEKIPSLTTFFDGIGRYILTTGEKPLSSELTAYGNVSIYPAYDDEFICYRKGIRVWPKNNERGLYRYDFSSIVINESRICEYPHQVGERMGSFFAKTTNKAYIQNYLDNWKDHKEQDIYWEYVHEHLSSAWEEILLGKRVYPEKYATHSGDFEGKFNGYIVPNKLAEKISKDLPKVTVVGFSKKGLHTDCEATKEELESIKIAVNVLDRYGYTITCPIKVAEFVDKDVVARYDTDTKEILLSRTHFTHNQAKLQNTLLEEYFHSMGLADGERKFVTFLIDEIINTKCKQFIAVHDRN